MTFQVVEHSDPREFHDRVIDHLMSREAECCAEIGLVCRLARAGYAPTTPEETDDPLFWTIEKASGPVAVVIQTLKQAMIVSRAPDGAMETLARSLANRNWTGKWITGVSPSVLELVNHFGEMTKRPAHLVMSLRCFQLEHVIWPPPIAGELRQCVARDRESMATLIAYFVRDIGEPMDEAPLATADRLIAKGRLF